MMEWYILHNIMNLIKNIIDIISFQCWNNRNF